MQLTGIIINFNKDWKTGKAIVTLLLDTANMEYIEKLSKLEKLTIAIKKFLKRRSLDANAYFHVLINELATYHNISETEMKIKMNLDYGRIKGCKVPNGTNMKEIYKYSKWYKTDENGDDCYIFYKETHTLDTKEMAHLISGVVQECESAGIETRPKAEINALLESWDKK